MDKDPSSQFFNGEPIPRSAGHQLNEALYTLAARYGDAYRVGDSPLWVDYEAEDVADETLGVRSVYGKSAQDGQASFVWLNEKGSELLGGVLDAEGTRGKLLSIVEFTKQHNEQASFAGALYVWQYPRASEVEFAVECRTGNIDPNGEAWFDFFAFSRQLGIDKLWEAARQANAQHEQVIRGGLNIKTVRNVVQALKNLLLEQHDEQTAIPIDDRDKHQMAVEQSLAHPEDREAQEILRQWAGVIALYRHKGPRP